MPKEKEVLENAEVLGAVVGDKASKVYEGAKEVGESIIENSSDFKNLPTMLAGISVFAESIFGKDKPAK